MRAGQSLLLLFIVFVLSLAVSFALGGDSILEGELVYAPAKPFLYYRVIDLGDSCTVCHLFEDAKETGMLITMDTVAQEFGVVLYYEDAAATPTRQPLQNAMVVAYVFDEEGNGVPGNNLFRMYTDEDGKSSFGYSDWNESVTNFKFLYCPFCCPGEEGPDEWCGWEECLQMAAIPVLPGTTPDDAVPVGDVPADLNCSIFKPTMQVAKYSPPPTSPTASVPALCTIGLLIFAFLGGSLYMSGRNPFAGFQVGAPRAGRHIRYQARGRGWYVSLSSVLSSVGQARREARQGPQQAAPGQAFRSIRDAGKGRSGSGGRAGQAATDISGKGQVQMTQTSAGQRARGGEKGEKGKDRPVSPMERRQGESTFQFMGRSVREGRTFARAGDKGEGYGRLTAKALLGTIGGLLDRSTIGQIVTTFSRDMNFSFEQRMANWATDLQREARASVMAAAERSERHGSDQSVQFRISGEGVRTGVTVAGIDGECVAIPVSIPAAGRRGGEQEATIIVRSEDQQAALEALSRGERPSVSCMLETARDGQTIRYNIQHGEVVGLHRVVRDKQGNEQVAMYDIRGGNLTLTGIVVGGERYAAREVEGRSGEFSFHLFDARGGVEDRAAFSSRDAQGAAREAIAAGAQLNGTRFRGSDVELDMSRQLRNALEHQLDSRVTLTTEYFREDLGQVREERHDLYSHGMGDDATITVLDNRATRDGEPLERPREVADGTRFVVDGGFIREGPTQAGGRPLEGGDLAGRDRDVIGASRELNAALSDYAALAPRFAAEHVRRDLNDFAAAIEGRSGYIPAVASAARVSGADELEQQVLGNLRTTGDHEAEMRLRALEQSDPEQAAQIRKDAESGVLPPARVADLVSGAVGEMSATERESYMSALSRERREDTATYRAAADQAYREAAPDRVGDLYLLGLDVAHMDRDDARRTLFETLRRDPSSQHMSDAELNERVTSALGQLPEARRLARQYEQASATVPVHVDSYFRQLDSARDALHDSVLASIPEQRIMDANPREKDESADAYRARIAQERERVASGVVASLSSYSAAELSSPGGGRGARPIDSALADAGRALGTLPGQERAGFAADSVDFFRALASTGGNLSGAMPAPVGARMELNPQPVHAAFMGVTQVDVASRIEWEGRGHPRVGLPEDAYSVARQGMQGFQEAQYDYQRALRSKAEGGEAPQPRFEDSLHTLGRAVGTADHFVGSREAAGDRAVSQDAQLRWAPLDKEAADRGRRDTREAQATLKATEGIGISENPEPLASVYRAVEDSRREKLLREQDERRRADAAESTIRATEGIGIPGEPPLERRPAPRAPEKRPPEEPPPAPPPEAPPRPPETPPRAPEKRPPEEPPPEGGAGEKRPRRKPRPEEKG